MRILLLAGGCLLLLVANVLLFATLVPLRPGGGTAYLLQMAAATLLPPGLVVLGLLSRKRFRKPRLLLRGVMAGLVGSLALSAASVALAPPAPRLPAWDAAERQAHLDQRCRSQCRHRGTSPELCDELCACTVEALFTGRSEEELQRLTAEGPYGMLSRDVNVLFGELGARCAAERREAQGLPAKPPAS